MEDTTGNSAEFQSKNKPRVASFFLPRGLLISVLILLFILGIGEVSKHVALKSKHVITKENKKAITITGEKGGYYSDQLQIYIPLYTDTYGTENMDLITLHDKDKKGSIKIERYKVDYTSLDDAEKRTKNQIFKNAAKHNFETEDYLQGKIYEINDPKTLIYALYLDGFIYNFETEDSEMYSLLDHVARRMRYQIQGPNGREYPRKKEPIWVLRKISSQGNDDLFEFNRNGLNYIYRWKDTLLYTYMYGDKNILSVFQHDLKSGKTQRIFTKITDELAMGDLTIIDDTLYISIGGYLKPGESYWIDLNSKDMKVNKLADIGGNIINIKNRYYFTEAEGDACWGSASYSLIDLSSKKITKVADTVIGCVPGDEYLGINNNDQMVLSTFKGAPELEGYGYQEANLYTNLIVIPLSKPTTRQLAITPYAMPPGILAIQFSDSENKVLMVGDSIYTYSFDTNKTEEIAKLPYEWIDYKTAIRIDEWEKSHICISKKEEGNKKELRYSINIETKEVSKDASHCPTDYSRYLSNIEKFPETKQDIAKKVYRQLKLPPNYVLTQK